MLILIFTKFVLVSFKMMLEYHLKLLYTMLYSTITLHAKKQVTRSCDPSKAKTLVDDEHLPGICVARSVQSQCARYLL